MSELISQKAFEAIKNDDAAAYAALLKENRIGAYRYGRFPALSLMYLFKSKKLIKQYEEELLKVGDYAVQSEPVAAFSEFKKRAGKCLRLYFDEVVSPLEMLLILDRTKRLKRVYPLTKLPQGVKQRLKSIYSIKYGLSVKFENDNIILDRRPLSYGEKKRIVTACVSALLVVSLCVGVPTATVALIPEPVKSQLEKIDFSSKNEYTLEEDLILPENYTVEKVNCKIDGNGKKLIVKDGATFGTLNGNISNITVETTGNRPLFETVSETATVENLTVTVNADISLSEQSAFIIGTNYGTVKDVAVTVGGKLYAVGAEAEEEEISSLTFGGIVRNNSYKVNTVMQTTYFGLIDGCTVNYDNFSLVGDKSANASFGGVAGINYGYVQNCTVGGNITADTFDIAGVCVENYGLLSGDKNSASLFQTTEISGWNSMVAGIVISNANAVDGCENGGDLVAKSESGKAEGEQGEATVSAAGIACLSRGNYSSLIIRKCKNYGSVTASAEYRNVYAAGVCVSNNSGIYACENYGGVSATTGDGMAIYTGGISSLAYGYIVKSVNGGALSADGDGATYAGGIASLSVAQLLYCRSEGDISIKGNTVYAGGILGCGELVNDIFGVYAASVESCISESVIKAVKVEKGAAYIGGIAGYLREKSLESNNQTKYYSGKITGSYFTGSIEADGYLGNIAGACGINIYESNVYMSNNTEYPYFDKNFYLQNSLTAFGAAFDAEGNYSSVSDKGAQTATKEEIENDENYQKILSEIAAEQG